MEPSHLPCSSLTHPAAILTPSIGVLRWIRAYTPNDSSIFSAVERSSYGVVSALTQLTRNSANVTSIALAPTVVVTTMGAKGVEPSLDAVSPMVADAFLAGLRLSFWLMAGVLVVGVVISFIRGERAEQRAAPAEQAWVRESAPGESDR